MEILKFVEFRKIFHVLPAALDEGIYNFLFLTIVSLHMSHPELIVDSWLLLKLYVQLPPNTSQT